MAVSKKAIGTRVPFKIYKFDNQNDAIANYKQELSTSRYLYGVTTDDIRVDSIGIEFLDVTGDMFVGSSFATNWFLRDPTRGFHYQVYYDATKRLRYIFDPGGWIWYVRDPTTKALSSQEIFEFYVSPQRIDPTWEKLQTETRTRGGWEVQHWGERLTEVQVTCKTGSLVKKGDSFLLSNEDITESDAWRRVEALKRIFHEDHINRNTQARYKLGMYYMNKMFIGYFTRFQGPTLDVDKPNIMDFSFSFKVEEEL